MVISQSHFVGTEQRQGRSQTLSKGGGRAKHQRHSEMGFLFILAITEDSWGLFRSAQRLCFAFYPVISVFLGSALTPTIIKIGFWAEDDLHYFHKCLQNCFTQRKVGLQSLLFGFAWEFPRADKNAEIATKLTLLAPLLPVRVVSDSVLPAPTRVTGPQHRTRHNKEEEDAQAWRRREIAWIAVQVSHSSLIINRDPQHTQSHPYQSS